jgi:uncharacterized protein YbaP (TraB family)
MSAICRRLAFLVLTLVLALPAEAAGLCGGRDLMESDGRLSARVAGAAETVNADATFWRVEAPDGRVAPSWLLGTIHLTDDRVTALPGPVAAALDGARVLAVENTKALDAGADTEAMRTFLALAVYTEGGSLKSVLDAAETQALLTALKARGLPNGLFLAWKPWAVVVSALTYPPCEMKRLLAGTPFLDAALVARAKAAGKPIADLEDFAAQLGSIAAVPDDVQAALLKGTLKLEPLQADLHETMVRLYLAGRIGTLIGLSKTLMEDAMPGADFAPFWSRLLDARNRVMVARAAVLAGEGNAFIAAGAGHLIGDTGLVAGLRRAGFRVEPVR